MSRPSPPACSALRERYRRRAELAAADLAETAVEGDDGIELDVGILFGPLLYDGGHRAIVLAADDMRLVVERATLLRARRCLRGVGPVRAFVDAEAKGLHLRWRGGAGGLNLRSSCVAVDRQRLLVVPLRRRRPTRPVLLRHVIEELGFL